MSEFHCDRDQQQAAWRESRRDFLKESTIAVGAAMAGGLSLSRSVHAAEDRDSSGLQGDVVKSFCIEYNFGPGGPNAFSAPGDCADADPKEHVKWFKSLGANVIQTFAVSCDGYAWYKNSIVPEQPGLKHDFLSDVVELGHQDDMLVMGYYCIAANVRWGQLHPDESYGLPADGHIPLTKKYNDYLADAITDALNKTNMDGFMVDWLFHGPIHALQVRWLPCEIEMWAELMEGPFPGKDEVSEAETLEFTRRSVDRCWQRIRGAAKSAKPDCIIWLTVFDLNHPQVVGSAMIKEADWLMNEGGTIEELKQIEKNLGRGNLINCLAAWNGADARTVIPATLEAGFGLYGFASPTIGAMLPSIDDYYLAKDIDELTGKDEVNIATLARAYRGLPLP